MFPELARLPTEVQLHYRATVIGRLRRLFQPDNTGWMRVATMLVAYWQVAKGPFPYAQMGYLNVAEALEGFVQRTEIELGTDREGRDVFRIITPDLMGASQAAEPRPKKFSGATVSRRRKGTPGRTFGQLLQEGVRQMEDVGETDFRPGSPGGHSWNECPPRTPSQSTHTPTRKAPGTPLSGTTLAEIRALALGWPAPPRSYASVLRDACKQDGRLAATEFPSLCTQHDDRRPRLSPTQSVGGPPGKSVRPVDAMAPPQCRGVERRNGQTPPPHMQLFL